MSASLDRRLNAYRADLADSRLEGRVEAARFADGIDGIVVAPLADLRPAPDRERGIDTQLLRGQTVRVFDHGDGWAWVQANLDGYVGYVETTALHYGGPSAPVAPTHIIAVPRSFTYPQPDLKKPARQCLSMASLVTVVDTVEMRGTRYAITEIGEAIIAHHLLPVTEVRSDYVAVAETLLHTPYLWGGVSAFGIDCSGIVQLSMRLCGTTVLRDSDMQAATIGTALPGDAPLKRGDLVFWKGHVGIMRDTDTLLHANGHTMDVALEPLADAIERIGYLYGQPTHYRRP